MQAQRVDINHNRKGCYIPCFRDIPCPCLCLLQAEAGIPGLKTLCLA